jgi:signal transduction histidine kinase/ActR/RegA family two-component response regulator
VPGELARSAEPALDVLADELPALLWAVDRAGVFTMVAGKGLKLFPQGSRPAVGLALPALFGGAEEFLAHVRRGLAGAAFSARVELAGRVFESRYEPVRGENGATLGLAGVLTDVTEQIRSERSLMHAQKMESLGVMAGSVAHDFNNLLTGILGFAGLLKQSPNLDSSEREELFLIEQSARRGADIASRLLSFSRGGQATFLPLDLRDVLRESVEFLQPTLSDQIRLDVQVPEKPVFIEGDFGQLQQAILNIAWNARDVLPEGGRIGIRLEEAAGQARLTISDTGPGMDPDVRARIFEPFFTTKTRGGGTGLGLSIAYGIARGHRGEIEVLSERGTGTAFTLLFPVVTTFVGAARQPDAGAHDLILLVDDDDLVRRATAGALAALGYSVIDVQSGSMAIDLVRACPGRFAAVLLDLVMPGVAGRDVFAAVKQVRADLPVIVCTGFAAASHIDDAMRRQISGLLQKPFSPERLGAALRSVGAIPTGTPVPDFATANA